MPVHNVDIAKIFEQIADLLEIQDANPFRVRAYRNAARTVSSMAREAADMAAKDEDLTSLPGIGKDLAGKIKTIVASGTLPLLEELQKGVAKELTTLMEVEGLGPKRVSMLHKKLGITNLKELKEAAQAGTIRELSGFGPKTEQKILEDLSRVKEGAGRVLLVEAEQFAESYRAYLEGVKGVKKVIVAGSYRRRLETVGDLDILVTCKKDAPVMESFVGYDEVARIISQGKTRSTVVLRSGMQVDLRVVPGTSYGAALHYFTGSKAHNIAVRKRGTAKKLKINEYGVYRGKKKVAGATEQEVYAQVDLPYIEPELREDRGEIEAALNDALPRLITLGDIKGDLHCHSQHTDGRNSIKEMVQAARELDYEYLAITDHSKRVSVAKGLDEKRLRQQMEEIDDLNDTLSGITLLKGIEVDILPDGSLDLPDTVLRDLDIVVCSVHSKFDLSRDKQTERIIRAMDNPFFNILAHPTARMLGSRQPYELDMDRLMRAAAERAVFLELNAQPQRMDLTDIHLKRAKEIGVQVVISTDAHWQGNLNYMRFGVGQARRGWLEADNVVNTRSLTQLRRLLKR
ncbi:MAG: DNA polymerase/3'-5' exonuclease PolX [Desulfurivibrionaceae bacterium]|nr:DNA polymerase/3'-5' exonuclease PolX [Desulfurivibrionaceae bacterium]